MLSSIITFIYPYIIIFGLKSEKKCCKFYCTGLLCSNKQVHLGAKYLALFIHDLMWNWVRLLLVLQILLKTYKSCKNQTRLKKHRNFLVFNLFLVIFHLNVIFIKRLLTSILTCVNPEHDLWIEIWKKMLQILLHWFAT